MKYRPDLNIQAGFLAIFKNQDDNIA